MRSDQSRSAAEMLRGIAEHKNRHARSNKTPDVTVFIRPQSENEGRRPFGGVVHYLASHFPCTSSSLSTTSNAARGRASRLALFFIDSKRCGSSRRRSILKSRT